jgi:hypothetical protein|uniref:RING-type domain-containing protein n=1 Tax=viral metagenome TaxID=1070528 RepID=A0A6C0AKF9_9ZZZZ
MSNNEITVLPINLLQSFIDSNENSIKMLNNLIDNTIERQYILISDSLNLLDNSRRSARQMNTPSYLGRSVSSSNRSNRYYRRQSRSPIINRPLRRSTMNSIFSPTPPSHPPPPPPPQNNMSTQTSLNNIFRDFTRTNNGGFSFTFGEYQPGTLTSIPITPCEEQINNATISDTFENIENTSDQTRCPIDQQEFVPSDNILKIKYCGHIFKSHNLKNWFNHSSRCPVCRFDIRDHSNNEVSPNDVSSNDISSNDISSNDVSSNDISSNEVSPNTISTNDINLEVILEQTVRNINSGPALTSMINFANNLANQIIETTDISGALISNNTNN